MRRLFDRSWLLGVLTVVLLTLPAATTATAEMIHEEYQFWNFIDSKKSVPPPPGQVLDWECGAGSQVPASRCYADPHIPDRYIINGLAAVRKGNDLFFYIQMTGKLNGPGSQYQRASFHAFKITNGWHAQRGLATLNLMNDAIRGADDTWEWTVADAFYDARFDRVYVSAGKVPTGNNQNDNWSEVMWGESNDGVNFTWDRLMRAERGGANIRVLGTFLRPHPTDAEWVGVLAWLDLGTSFNGTTPLRVRPLDGQFDLQTGPSTWTTYSIGATLPVKPYRIPGRAMALSDVTVGGTREFQVWRVQVTSTGPNHPCAQDPAPLLYYKNISQYPTSGREIQYTSFDPDTLQVGSTWRTYGSRVRDHNDPSQYPASHQWVLSVVDYGLYTFAYWSSRDNVICTDSITAQYDKGVGRMIFASQISTTIQ